MTKRIVVGVDGSEGAAVALRFAVAEGQARELPVTALLGWGWLDQAHDVVGTFHPDYTAEHAAAALRTFLEDALGDQAGSVTPLVVNDLPARALLEASGDAELLVVGGRGMGGFKALLVGSVSHQVVSHAPCPVAVVHSSWTPEATSGRVVVAVDGSENSLQALEWAVRDAAARGAALEVVHAWSVPNTAGFPYSGMVFEPAPFKEAADRVLAEALGRADVSVLDQPPTAIALEGHPASAVLDHAEGADLLVIGSRGLGGFKGLLLGSVSQRLAQYATCPVVVVPLRS